MTFDLETYELIDRYLKGLLSDEERILFEKQQNENPAFAEEVKLQTLINDLVLEKGLADIRTKVGEDLSNAKGGSWFKTSILFAGAFCLIAAGATYYYSYYSKEEVSSNLKVTEEAKKEDKGVSTGPAISLKEVQKDKNEPSGNSVLAKEAVSGSLPNNTSIAVKGGDLQQVNIVEDKIKPQGDYLKENEIKIIEPAPQQEPCENIIFEAISESSCFQKQTGKIQILISGIKGGRKPYAYSINGNDFGLGSIYQNLGEGDYLVQVKDSRGCISERQIHINEKPCVEFSDYSFNPSVETWKFPLNEYESGTITITDISGRIIYSNKISPSDSWNGRSLNGDTQESGSYLYIIESNGIKIKQGYITIFY